MIIIMGVSGTGKTSLGKHLSQLTSWPFYDADDFHSEANKSKMKSGDALNDLDRLPWLNLLSLKIEEWSKQGETILACSALKEGYRKILSKHYNSICWVVLNGSFELIQSRLKNRKNHYFSPLLLKSQLDTLELPLYGIKININQAIEVLSADLLKKINTMSSSGIGIIGLGVMGQGIALNFVEKGIITSVYNRSVPGEDKIVSDFVNSNNALKNLKGFSDLAEFIKSLQQPRKIWLMIKSGFAVDSLIKELLPLLNKGDVIVDGGNSHYKDTQRRVLEAEKRKIHYVGCGVSGGEAGARYGASIMFGGSPQAYDILKPLLNNIAAIDRSKNPCQGNMGTDGAGHFVKMIHNGIEYAEMQLLAETFSILKNQMVYSEIASLFEEWNKGSLGNYLLQITAEIFKKKEGEHYLLDLILDSAQSKGTGAWSSSTALALGQVNTMMSSAVFARNISSLKTQRLSLSERKPIPGKSMPFNISKLKEAYRFARIINHIQGFNLIEAASKKYNWNYKPSEIARVWTQGCIIRSSLMEELKNSFTSENSLLKNSKLLDSLSKSEPDIADFIHYSIDQKIALDSYSSAYNYWIALCTENLPANLIQAQRDFFGAHTYQRVDKPLDQFFHTQW